jgi:hypothetical protein
MIDGQTADRAVKGVKVHPDHWDAEDKRVDAGDPKAKAHNKKLNSLVTDVFRAIDLVKAKDGLATPDAVWKLLLAPKAAPDKSKSEKRINLEFSLKLRVWSRNILPFEN